MNKAVKSTFVGVAVLVLIGGVALSVRGHQADDDDKPKKAAPGKKPGKLSEGVKLDRETQERIGIELQRLKPSAERSEVTVYGTLEADPSEEFVLRSPLAGFVVSHGNWPSLGANLAWGAKIGVVRPRLTAVDQLTLKERLVSARTEAEAAQSSVTAARVEVNRLKQLNADNKNASDKSVEEAVARLSAEDARLKAAQGSVQLIGDTLQPESDEGAAPLEMAKGGQVLEVSAQPGESVESGQTLIRVASFNHLLARLYVPPGQTIDGSVLRATIMPTGGGNDAIPARRVSLAASIDPKYQGEILLFRLSQSKAQLRPGQAVTARLAMPGPEEHGVLIPSRAILRYQGQTWVYVQTEAGEFVRRAVTLDHPARGGWLVTSGFQPDQQVVVSGGQVLLSEEMKSQLESDEQ
ncbi:MAG: HlyD family efflux transporter periplasmic adaptor subunit [Acidobacteriota bacterium]|nr:HlyD family efflux transporter periplasmic adaptor subunit [Acidobacteriota bacterium]